MIFVFCFSSFLPIGWRKHLLDNLSKGNMVLTRWDARAHVHCCNLDLAAGGQVPLRLAGDTSSDACGGRGVVVDDDTDAGATLARAELDLGSLDQSGLSILQGAVEAGQVTLVEIRGLLVAGKDSLAHALERGDLLGLGGMSIVSLGIAPIHIYMYIITRAMRWVDFIWLSRLGSRRH